MIGRKLAMLHCQVLAGVPHPVNSDKGDRQKVDLMTFVISRNKNLPIQLIRYSLLDMLVQWADMLGKQVAHTNRQGIFLNINFENIKIMTLYFKVGGCIPPCKQ